MGVLTAGLPEYPQDAGQEKGKNKVKDGPHDSDDDLVRITDRGQFFGFLLAAAFDGAHIGQLGQGHITTQRKGRDAVIHAVTRPAEYFWSETDGEAVNFQPSEASGEEVPQLVNEDRSSKKEAYEKYGPEIGKKLAHECGVRIHVP